MISLTWNLLHFYYTITNFLSLKKTQKNKLKACLVKPNLFWISPPLFLSLHSRKVKKNQSSLVHRGLVVAIFLLCLFFILTGTIANVGNKKVCEITGTLLHYSLLSTLCWMAMEVFHTFLLVHKVFSATPPWVFYLGGFGEYKHTFIYLF